MDVMQIKVWTSTERIKGYNEDDLSTMVIFDLSYPKRIPNIDKQLKDRSFCLDKIYAWLDDNCDYYPSPYTKCSAIVDSYDDIALIKLRFHGTQMEV